MARTFAAIIFFLGYVSAAGETECSSCNTEVTALKTQLVETQAELAETKEAGQCQSFSMLEVGSKAKAVGANVVNHLLSQTELDEKVTNMATEHFSKGKEFVSGLMDKASGVNYRDYVKELKSHPFYLSNVAPHVDKAMAAAQPHIDQHMAPALEKASVHLAPVMKMASEQYDKASGALHSDVLPKLKTYRAQAYDKHVEAQLFLDQRLLAPVFDSFARVAPDHAASLPQSSLDRVFFLLVAAFLLYNAVFLGRKMLQLAFFVLRICFKSTWKVFSVLVLLPIAICFRILGFFLWIGTCFHCCGLCTPKSKASNLSDAASKTKDDKNSKKEAGKKEDNDVKDATVAEIKTLLENAKKEKKLEAAAKQLAGLVKSGKAMSTPKSMANKKVTKDVLTKACATFKEVDIKKLGM